jgi:hypothetical protein
MTTTYTLTATNAQGSQTSTASITVIQQQASITTCTATPMTIIQGESATIQYNTTNATSVTISPGVGAVGNNGSVVVSPTATTNYTITATNSFGSNTCSVGIQVNPGQVPRIVKFAASPLSIASGSSSTLLWVVENATSVTIDNGVGSVDVAGTATVSPTTTTTYTLTAKNNFGQATAQATVTVVPPPPTPQPPTISSFTANPPQSTNPGSAVVLTCKANNASQVVISGVGPVDANGNRTVNPTTTTTYVCVAVGTNPAQQASANLTVPVSTGSTGGGGTGPVISISSPNASCVGPVQPSNGATTVCQTVVRTIQLNLTATSTNNSPVSFTVTSRNTSSVVLNPNSSMPTVQLSELFGDYFFDVVATDANGNTSTATVDVQLVVTRVR